MMPITEPHRKNMPRVLDDMSRYGVKETSLFNFRTHILSHQYERTTTKLKNFVTRKTPARPLTDVQLLRAFFGQFHWLPAQQQGQSFRKRLLDGLCPFALWKSLQGCCFCACPKVCTEHDFDFVRVTTSARDAMPCRHTPHEWATRPNKGGEECCEPERGDATSPSFNLPPFVPIQGVQN